MLCHGSELPKNTIDGKDVWPLITSQPGAGNPHTYYPITVGGQFQAVISADGRWKLHLPHKYWHVVEPGVDEMPGKQVKREIELSLFNLELDPGETRNVIEQYAEVAKKLQLIAAQHRARFWPEEKK